MPTPDNPNAVLNGGALTQIKNLVYVRAKQYAPKHIANGIQVNIAANTAKQQYSIWFHVNIKQKGLEDARAQEYGSGLYAQRKFASPKQQAMYAGGKLVSGGKILIKPKNKKALAFVWDRAPKKLDGRKITNDNRSVFMYVYHPGIHAVNSGRGYLRAALKDSQEEINTVLTEYGISVNVKVRNTFIRAGGSAPKTFEKELKSMANKMDDILDWAQKAFL